MPLPLLELQVEDDEKPHFDKQTLTVENDMEIYSKYLDRKASPTICTGSRIGIQEDT